MQITFVTMFPELLEDLDRSPVIARALRQEAVTLKTVDIKDFAGGSFRHIDDSPFGGGSGMIMRAQPVLDALASVMPAPANKKEGADSENAAAPAAPETDSAEGNAAAGTGRRRVPVPVPRAPKPLVCALTPSGHPYTQATARRFAAADHLVLLCGHYEGMDERIYSHVDERISIGDYILTGGETAARVVADSVIRLLPGVLKEGVTEDESFENGLLEYPQYTQPADLDGARVPDVLLSGDHEKIRLWRLKESLRMTLTYRPGLLDGRAMTPEERTLLDEILGEILMGLQSGGNQTTPPQPD